MIRDKKERGESLDAELARRPEERKKLDLIERLAAAAVEVIKEKKGGDVELMRVTEKTTLADVFILASGTSGIHVRTLADSVEERLKERFDLRPDHIEGMENRTWVLLDYGDLVIHLMLPEDRAHYKLENLWRATTDKRMI